MAENKRYYWLKLKEDFFRDREIKKLRKIAGGDTYTIIYLKLLLLGLRDEGKLIYEGIEDSFCEEMALEIDEDAENVKIAMLTLLKMGMLQEISANEMFLTRLPECVGSETRQAEIMRKKRTAKALKDAQSVTMLPDVTNCYTEKEIDKEKREKRIDNREKIDYQLIADMYNETCVSFPRVKTLSETRKKEIKARLKTYTIEQFKQLFEKAEANSFLKGNNDRNWRATFDWLIKDANFAKVIDGNYDGSRKKPETIWSQTRPEDEISLDDLF